MISKVLFVGIGTISKGIIKNLLGKTNVKVNVYSSKVNSQNEKYLCTDDLMLSLKGVQMIISCVPDDQASRDFWYHTEVKKYLEVENPYCVEMSTLSYSYIIEWSNYINKLECKSIESPLTGSKTGAEKGDLSLFVYSQYFNEVEEIFKSFSKKIYKFSVIGEPTKFKLFYNMWGAGMLYLLAEMYPIMKNEFIDSVLVNDIVSTDGWMAQICSSILPRVNKKTYKDVNFKYKYMVKDVNYSKDVFKYNTPILNEIYNKYNEYNDDVVGDLDFSIIVGKNAI